MATHSSLLTSPAKFIESRESGQFRGSWSSELMGKVFKSSQNLYRKDLFAHYGCVNAIEFCNDGEWLVSGGDDRRVALWNVEKAIHGTGKPFIMSGEHNSNIFCLGFDNDNTKIFSAGNDEQVIVHDARTGATIDVFLHEEAVYGLSVDPLNSNVFASACDDGRILIWDIREPSSSDPFCLTSCSNAFHAVMYNPVEPRLLACANSKEGMTLWDIRRPKLPLLKYDSGQSFMSVRFNSSGTQIFALRRRLPPALYDIYSPKYVHQFDHPGYYNVCTMKSCCFAGERDQYVLSGSDDFNLYVWEIPKSGNKISRNVNETHMILKGHRSIVNQVRFNPHNFLLASSGVEKIIKLWSPFELPQSSGGLKRDCATSDVERKIYSHEDYVNLVSSSGQAMTHDYSQQSICEDPRMMAFFDTLVHREIEGLNTDSNQSVIHSDSWLFNVVDGFSMSEGEESTSNVSSDSESITIVSDDRGSEASEDVATSLNNDDERLENGDTRFSMQELNHNNWQTDSTSSSLLASSISSFSCSSLSSDEDEKQKSKNSGGEENRLQSWSSGSDTSSSVPTSLESISSSENETRRTSALRNKKILSRWERMKFLRKRRFQSTLELDDSELESEGQNSSSKNKKRICLKLRGIQSNKNGKTCSMLTSSATTSNERVSNNESSNEKDISSEKCTVVCVAAQNSSPRLQAKENEEVEDQASTTPDSGIASRSFDNEKPSPSTSNYDLSECFTHKFNKNSKARNGRVYRSRRKTHPDSD